MGHRRTMKLKWKMEILRYKNIPELKRDIIYLTDV